MEIRFMLLIILFGLVHYVRFGEGGGHNHKKIILHLPVNVKEHKHVHTIVKHIHHHHKPIVIKEEKVIKQEYIKPIHIKEEVNHEHYHHHYKHDHHEEYPQIEHEDHEQLGDEEYHHGGYHEGP